MQNSSNYSVSNDSSDRFQYNLFNYNDYIADHISLLFLPIFLSIMGTLVFIVTFIFFYIYNEDELPDYNGIELATISKAGAYLPERGIFTGGLHIGSCLSLFLFWGLKVYLKYKLYYRKRELIEEENRNESSDYMRVNSSSLRDTKNTPLLLNNEEAKHEKENEVDLLNNAILWNDKLYKFGIGFAITLFLTGSISLEDEWLVHCLVAGAMFIFGVLHNVFLLLKIYIPLYSLFINDDMSLKNYKLKKWTGIFSLLFMILYLFVFSIWQDVENCFDDEWCTIRSVKSLNEYFLALFLMIYIYSFRYELSTVELSITKL